MVELKGIVSRLDAGHRLVEVIVKVGTDVQHQRHRVDVDKPVGKGRIISYLCAMYDAKPADILWPGHIKLKQSDID